MALWLGRATPHDDGPPDGPPHPAVLQRESWGKLQPQSNTDLLGQLRQQIRDVGWPADWLPTFETTRERTERLRAASARGVEALSPSDRGLVRMLAEQAGVPGDVALGALLDALNAMGAAETPCWRCEVRDGALTIMGADGRPRPPTLDAVLDDAFDVACGALGSSPIQ